MMNADILGPQLKAAASSIDAELFKTDPEAARDAMFKAFAAAIILHIQTFADITVVGVTAGTATVVTPGPAGIK